MDAIAPMPLITCLTDNIKAPLMTNKHPKIQSTKTPNTKVAALKNGMYPTQLSSPSRPPHSLHLHDARRLDQRCDRPGSFTA